MKKINLNINLGALIIIGVLIFILIGGGFKLYSNKIDNLKTDLKTEVNLKNALLDTVTNYQNQKKEWVSEKLTIQASIDDLEKENVNLSNSQKDLLSRIKSVESEKNKLKKEKEVIAAALIETEQIVDSLKHEGETVVDTMSKKITFSDTYEKTVNDIKYSLNYDFTVGNVLPFDNSLNPFLTINSLTFPNEQFIDFHWNNDKKNDYPISFSVSNTNGFYQTTNIDSYAIPNLKKELVNPTGWQKFTNFFKENNQKIMYIGIGGALGVGTYIILTN